MTILGLLLATGCLADNELGHIRAEHFGDLSHGEPERVAFDARLEEACGTGELTRVGASVLSREPYVQRLASDRGALLFGAEQGAEVALFRPDGDDGALDSPAASTVDGTALPPSGRQYWASLGTLVPGRIHCYQIRGGDGAWTEPGGFYTAPEPEATVTFSAFGDLGKGTSDQMAVRDELMQVQSDFVLVTGDVAYDSGTRQELQSFFFDVYAPLIGHVPFFPAIGNHDAKTEGGAPLLEAFALPETGGKEELHYAFDWGPVHVAVINTESPTDAQAQWLASDLAASDAAWKVVAGHTPPYSSGSHGGDGEIRDVFEPVFVSQGVDLAFFGHEHNYERTVPLDGVTYVVTGGGGTGTRPVDTTEITAHSNRVSHFVHVEASPEALTMWAVDATGQVFDTMKITR